MSGKKTSTKKTNTTVKIVCEDPMLAGAMFTLLEGHQVQNKTDLNSIYANRGLGLVDVTFSDFDHEKLVIRASSNPTDKGEVLVLQDKVVNIIPYTELEENELYGYIEGSIKIFEYNSDGIDKHLQSATSMGMLVGMLTEFPAQLEAQRAATETETKTREAAASVADENPKLKAVK